MTVRTRRAQIVRSLGIAAAVVALTVAGAGLARAARAEVLIADGVLVRLDDRMPDRPAPCERIVVAQEVWDEQRIEQMLGQDTEPVELPTGVARAGDSGWFRLGESGLVRLGQAGAGFYITMSDPVRVESPPDPSYDASRAVELAGAYVRDHGGLPLDAELWSVREVLAVGLSLDDDADEVVSAEGRSRRSIGHYVEFKHAVDGIPVDSPAGGDSIKVRVDDSGRIRSYGRVWRKIRERTSSGQLLGPREALASGIKGGGLRGAKTTITGTVRLRDARPVYLSGSRDARVTVLRPAWRFVLEGETGSQRIYVDAETGRPVLEE